MTRALSHVSASQIEAFSLCERKWYFKSILGLPTPEHPAATLGKSVHGSIEAYLDGHATPAELHPLARRVYDRGLLPAPYSVWVEHQIPDGELTIAGVPVAGYLDVLDLGPPVAPPKVRVPLITDWKTRGDPARYSKSDEELAADVQGNIYAAEAFRVLGLNGGGDAVQFRHVNRGTKPPNAVTVSGPVTFTREAVADYFERRLVPTVEKMKTAAGASSPLRVTPTWQACTAFGGCPFRDKCQAAEKVGGISTTPDTPEDLTMPQDAALSAKEAILARLRGAGTPVAPSVAVRPPDAPAPVNTPPSLAARLEAAPAVAPAQALVTVAEEPRKPRGHEAKLAALAYDPAQIARMKAAEMRRVIEGSIHASGVSVLPDGTVVATPPKASPVAPAESAGLDLTDLDACVVYAIGSLGWKDAEIDAMPDDMLVFVAKEKTARDTVDLVFGDDGKIADLEARPVAPRPPP